MSMNSSVYGIVPADAKFKKMKELFDRCREMGVEPPKEVWDFFGDEPPLGSGTVVNIGTCVSEVQPHEMSRGFEVDLVKLALEFPNVKIVQFTNNY